MATVIDSLVVTLGLDTSQFTKGQRDAIAAANQTVNAMSRGGRQVEVESGRVANSLNLVKREAVGLLAEFFGAKGVKDFVQKITQVDAATGRLAYRLDISTQSLSAWQSIGKLNGDTAESMAGAMQNLTSEVNRFQLTGTSSMIPWLNQLGIKMTDANGKLKTADTLFMDISKSIQGMDPARQSEILSGLGLGGATNTLLNGPEKLKAMLDEQVRLGLITQKDADAAIALSQAWLKAEQAATSLGRTITTWLTPALLIFLDRWKEVFVELNKHGIRIDPDSLLGHALGLKGQDNSSATSKTARSIVEFLMGPKTAEEMYGAGGGSGGGGAGRAAPSSTSLPFKPGSGTGSPAVLALAAAIQATEPGLQQITAMNDSYHAGTNSKHAQGLALDFTVAGGAQVSAATAARIRAYLKAMGVGGTVLDEYNNPSARSTGGHIHVQFADADAANKYLASREPGAAGVNNNSTSSNTSTTININKIDVVTQATNGNEVAQTLGPALTKQSFGAQSVSGPR